MQNRRFLVQRVNKDKATNFSHKNRAHNFHLFGFGEGNRRGEEIISSFLPLFPVGKKKTSSSQLEQEKKIWGEDRVDGGRSNFGRPRWGEETKLRLLFEWSA